MTFPATTLVTALAMFGLLAGGAARAEDDAKTKPEFTKRLFAGDVVKGKTSYACFVRRYDAVHLAKHLQQKVAAMTLLLKAEVDAEDGQIQHSFRMGVKFRNTTDKFDTGGSCGHADVSETPGAPPRLGCGVDCDGGGISVELTPDNKSMLVRLERVRLWNNNKPEDDDEARSSLTAGADDAVFRLDRVSLDMCKSLVTDKEELAALHLKRNSADPQGIQAMHRRNILAGLLTATGGLLAAAGATRAKAATAMPDKTKVVYHLSDLDKVRFVLGNIKNHYDGVGGPDHVTIELVVHGPALKAFLAASANADERKRIDEFGKTGLRLAACGNTMRAQNIELKDLLLGFVAADKGGVVRIAELQAMGYVYLRP